MPQTAHDFDFGAKSYDYSKFTTRAPQHTFSSFETISKIQLLANQIKWFLVETFHTTYTTYLNQNQGNLITKKLN